MNKRIAYYDQLRVLAILGIICCHVAADFITRNHGLIMQHKTFFGVLLFSSGRLVGVPVFLMLSGALLINKKDTLSEFIKKRFNRVLIPFIFWASIYVIFAVVIQELEFTPQLVFNIFFGVKGGMGAILWFVWMLMVVYIAIFIINKILEYGKSKSDNFDTNFINVLVLLSLILYLVYNMVQQNFPDNNIYYYASFIPFAIFGYFLTHFDFTRIRIGKIDVTPGLIVKLTFVLSILAYLVFVFVIYQTSIANGKFYSANYFDFHVLVFDFSLMLLFRYLPECKGKVTKKVNGFLSSKNVAKAILSISMASYGMYLVHILIIKLLEAKYLYRIKFYNSATFWLPILLIVVFFSSWFVVWILSKIPYVNKISGAS